MKTKHEKLTGLYMWLIIAAVTCACIYAGFNLPLSSVDRYLLLLAVVTAVIGSRIAIRIPQINVNITVDDTFVVIILLMYGGEAAILVGGLTRRCSGLRISKKIRTVAFGGA